MSKLNQNGSTVFLKVSEEIHHKLRQLAAVENKPVCQLVREMIDESLSRRRRGIKAPNQETYSNNNIDEIGDSF